MAKIRVGRGRLTPNGFCRAVFYVEPRCVFRRALEHVRDHAKHAIGCLRSKVKFARKASKRFSLTCGTLKRIRIFRGYPKILRRCDCISERLTMPVISSTFVAQFKATSWKRTLPRSTKNKEVTLFQ